MARVTVEDCVDKVANRFDLVLLAAHRARTISTGSQITVDRDNDKNPVVSLREIAEETIAPDDIKEDFIHSMQKYVEVDEPEPEAAPQVVADTGAVPVIGQDDPSTDTVVDQMSEEELIRGMENLSMSESGSASRRR